MRRPPTELPGREGELLAVTLLYAALFGLTAWKRADPTALYTTLVTLELALPLSLAVVASGLLAQDPALDLLLSVARPASLTLVKRTALLLGYGLVLAALLLLTARGWRVSLPVEGAASLLIWAAPAALLVGTALLGSLARGRMVDGVAASLTAAGLALLSVLGAGDCLPDPERACLAALASPLMTLARPDDSLWLLNRLLWLAVGGALILAAVRLAQDEERLLEPASQDE